MRTRNNAGTSTTDTCLNDSHGRRVEVAKNGVVEQRFIYDEHGRLIAELGAVGELKTHFVYATMSHAPDYLIKNGVTYKIVHDQLGSLRKIVESASGNVVSSLEYDEFGRVTASVARDFQPLGYAGGLRDDVAGFVRFGARDYDPETGGWTSKDPLSFRGGDINLYGYVLADPINFVDPTGLFLSGDQISGMIGGAISGVAGGAHYGTYVNPGFGTGFGALAGGLAGATLGGIMGPHVGRFIGPANASPLGPPRSESPLLPPLFQPPGTDSAPTCQ